MGEITKTTKATKTMTEAELRNYWLSNEIDEAMSFYEYEALCEKRGLIVTDKEDVDIATKLGL